MSVLMESYPIDIPLKKRVDMTSIVDLINSEHPSIKKVLDMSSDEHLKHYFADGCYVREMLIPADTVVVGRIHKRETINVLLEGEIVVFDESGTRKHLKAPHVFVAPPGNQKAAISITPVRWLNSFACETTNPEEALDLLTCETIHDYQAFLDSEDVKKLTSDLGYNEEVMRKIVNSDDVDMSEIDGVYLSESSVDGIGVFAEKEFDQQDNIGAMRNGEMRSILGRYTNHSLTPNSKPVFIDGVLSLACCKPIKNNEEITCNYRDVIKCREIAGDL